MTELSISLGRVHRFIPENECVARGIPLMKIARRIAMHMAIVLRQSTLDGWVLVVTITSKRERSINSRYYIPIYPSQRSDNLGSGLQLQFQKSRLPRLSYVRVEEILILPLINLKPCIINRTSLVLKGSSLKDLEEYVDKLQRQRFIKFNVLKVLTNKAQHEATVGGTLSSGWKQQPKHLGKQNKDADTNAENDYSVELDQNLNYFASFNPHVNL
ncbi:MAG: hypothetical protein M1834_007682 [Cirrosporium novae-zelandiae]|nr:MAG: hypothetical protein M1834_007682 [Cirrosporium novae-zelandiae]